MPNTWFQFKQFKVFHQKASFPVGTDACLLGAWIDVEHDGFIVDIGTGSGVLALMAAQRSTANILAIDIDKYSVDQALENFHTSPWSSRLNAMNMFFQDLKNIHLQAIPSHFICNPPFFHSSTKHSVPVRHNSRHDDQLPLAHLFEQCSKLSTLGTKLSVVYPFARWEEIQTAAMRYNWVLKRALEIKPNSSKSTNRILAEWRLNSEKVIDPNISSLTLYDESGEYTKEAKELLTPYYLYL